MTYSSSALFSSYNSLVISSGLSRTAVTLGAIAWTLSNGKLDYKHDNVRKFSRSADYSFFCCFIGFLDVDFSVVAQPFSGYSIMH